MVGLASRLLHRSLERGIRQEEHHSVVLELGAGHGEHFQFVNHSFDEYVESDIDINLLGHTEPDSRRRLRRQQLDAQTMNGVPESSVSRLVVTCLLSHLSDPVGALRNWRAVVVPGGLVSLYLPHEPGWALRVSQHLFTARKIERLGLDYWRAHYEAHPFHFPFLRFAVLDSFAQDRVTAYSFPFRQGHWAANLWTIFQIKINSD